MLCVDLVTRLQEDSCMKMRKNYCGVLRMTVNNEKLEFDETVSKTVERNPTVWSGTHINVHKEKNGSYSIHFRKVELTAALDPCSFADEIFLDVERAKVELGI